MTTTIPLPIDEATKIEHAAGELLLAVMGASPTALNIARERLLEAGSNLRRRALPLIKRRDRASRSEKLAIDMHERIVTEAFFLVTNEIERLAIYAPRKKG